MITALALLVLLTYYLFIWIILSRKPGNDDLLTESEPPVNHSPAAIRYTDKAHYDTNCFVAALVSLGVKGYLRIKESGSQYELENIAKSASLPADESVLSNKLFKAGNSIILDKSSHQRLASAFDAHELSFCRNFEAHYFISNRWYFIPGMLLTISALVSTLLMLPNQFTAWSTVIMITCLIALTLVVLGLIKTFCNMWRISHRTARGKITLLITLFLVPVLAAELSALWIFTELTSLTMLFVLFVAVLINVLFYELLKSPVRGVRELLRRKEGFRRFIDVTKRQELDHRHPNGRCSELFEKYLALAIAMNIERKWGEQFIDVLVKTQVSGRAIYLPAWYQGSYWDNYHIGDFSSSLGTSFVNAINDALDVEEKQNRIERY